MTKSERYAKLYELHGWKLDVPSNMLPDVDKSPLNGALRCFRNVFVRDDFGRKIKDAPKIRCKGVAVKGSFYCKKHGGGNSNALTTGKAAARSGNLFRGAYTNDLGNLFMAFLGDTALEDLRPEIATLRSILVKFIKELSHTEKIKGGKGKLRVIQNIIRDRNFSESERFMQIKEFVSNQGMLTDGDSIDKVSKLVEIIGRTTERMMKIQNQDKYVLTPDGLKLMLRCIIDILKQHVSEEKLIEIKDKMLEVSVRTQGDLRKYNEVKNITPKSQE